MISQLKKEIQNFNAKHWSTDRYFVEIYVMNGFNADKDEMLKLGLNWSAIGTVDINRTNECIKQLEEAKDLVSKIDSHNIRVGEW